MVTAGAVWGVWTLARSGGGSHRAAVDSRTPHVRPDPSAQPTGVTTSTGSPRLVSRRVGTLPRPVQDAAPAELGGGLSVFIAGLSAADTSTTDIRIVQAGRARVVGHLGAALHDAAAAGVAGSAYLFGGGNGVAQLRAIIKVDPMSGATTSVGTLPAASSDSSAGVIDGTVYVVGGYTGSRWLDSIVAWRPGGSARVVARLPQGVRYAAVAAAAGKLVIAGGTTLAGASDRVFVFDPATSQVSAIGRLPSATTHAAAAALGGAVYVIGGRGASTSSQTRTIIAIDPTTSRIARAGQLSSPTSDAAAASVGKAILLAGGRTPQGVTAALIELQVAQPNTSTAGVPAPASVAHPARGNNVYANAGAGMLSAAVAGAKARIYVPNSESNTVDVIDPTTFKVVDHFAVGQLPQHVTPSWDLKTLYVLNDEGNSLTPINPRTGRPGKPITVDDPYNMYFTVDGKEAIVVAERNARLDFRDPHSFKVHKQLSVPCRGVDHIDFTADGKTLLATCEFSGQLVRVDVARRRVVETITLRGHRAMPQDIKLSPDGRVFYVADLMGGGVFEIDARTFRTIGFLRTGAGVHGLYPSRNAKLLYASNRGEGSVSVISFATRKVIKKWRLPGGGSPDMGGVSADGKTLWLTGRYSGVVYAINTANGHLRAKIGVGSGPHGLCVWPQPGRFSLGHTGILR